MRDKHESNHSNMEISSDDDEKLFMNIAKNAASVVCCRVSPSQKSKVVLMMKRFYPSAVTLAIGDGGNDVPMIMEAHIGVGIYGEEGMRAVQSSDYAIGEFQFLRSLLLFHGRTNYIRNSECVKYFFYKNFCFTLMQFIFGFYCNFTGQTIIDDWFISCFNLLFTSLPLGARALLDHDVKPSDGIVVNQMLPFLYSENRENPIFTMPKFFLTLIKGAVHCCIIYFFIIYLYKQDSINSDGKMGGLWFVSVNLFTCVLIVVSVDLIIFTKYHTIINFLIMLVFTIIAYIIFVIVVHYSTFFKSVGTITSVFGSPRFWMSVVFVCGTCGLIDYYILGCKSIIDNSLTNEMQRLVNERGKLNEDYGLPKRIIDRINMYKTFEQQKVHRENEKAKIPQNREIIEVKEPLDSVYDDNNANNNKEDKENEYYDNSNYPMNTTNDEDEIDDIIPNFQRPSLGKYNDFNDNFGEIQRKFY